MREQREFARGSANSHAVLSPARAEISQNSVVLKFQAAEFYTNCSPAILNLKRSIL